ncbi:MAG TPA: hypothetical protein VGQ57_13395 [Polyangiaceae bacterium]|jgi:hypothetical protein|nr:hypothetical protein [Polyangiaceae bacterium]
MLSLSRALGAAWLAFIVSACGRHPTPVECNALLDRYTEKLVGSDRPEVKGGELEKVKADARARAAEDPEFLACPRKVSRWQYECAMQAETVDRMEICLN